MKVSAIPARFNQEPVDVRSYDAWQDGEGLLDASDACRDAWASWKPGWRKARDVELRLGSLVEDRRDWQDKLGPVAASGLRRARALGAQYGMCAASHKKRALRDDERKAWTSWRSRVLRHDPGLWWCIWAAIDGLPLGIMAARWGRDADALAAQLSVAFGWLHDELYPSTLFPGTQRLEGHAVPPALAAP